MSTASNWLWNFGIGTSPVCLRRVGASSSTSPCRLRHPLPRGLWPGQGRPRQQGVLHLDRNVRHQTVLAVALADLLAPAARWRASGPSSSSPRPRASPSNKSTSSVRPVPAPLHLSWRSSSGDRPKLDHHRVQQVPPTAPRRGREPPGAPEAAVEDVDDRLGRRRRQDRRREGGRRARLKFPLAASSHGRRGACPYLVSVIATRMKENSRGTRTPHRTMSHVESCDQTR